ncbi:MAG: hypothetical protein WC429_22175, partial [Verrucomicrobiia bacterium]
MIQAKSTIPVVRNPQFKRMSSKKKNIQGNGDSAAGAGLSVKQVFSTAGVHPFDELEWDRRTAEISDDGGKAIFKQENVEVPKSGV